MSCWRECNCALTEVKEDILKKAAANMGLGIDGRTHVGTSYGTYEKNDADVDGAFTQNGKELPIGFVYNDGTGHFGIRGDFWSTGLDSSNFLGTLGEEYVKEAVLAGARSAHYIVRSTSVNADGDTEIVIRQSVVA